MHVCTYVSKDMHAKGPWALSYLTPPSSVFWSSAKPALAAANAGQSKSTCGCVTIAKINDPHKLWPTTLSALLSLNSSVGAVGVWIEKSSQSIPGSARYYSYTLYTIKISKLHNNNLTAIPLHLQTALYRLVRIEFALILVCMLQVGMRKSIQLTS